MNAEVSQMKIDLDLEHISDTTTAEDVHRMRCHTFDNGMNIPEGHKSECSEEEKNEIYSQFKEIAAKLNAGDPEYAALAKLLAPSEEIT